MWDLMDKYEDTFNEQFPLMLFRGMKDHEIISILKECLEKGEPYDSELEEGCDY